jgi:hypothetical protein
MDATRNLATVDPVLVAMSSMRVRISGLCHFLP